MSAAILSTTPGRATIADLERTREKAELVNGRIIHLMPTGYLPGRISARIYNKIDDYVTATGLGVAVPDNVAFTVSKLTSGRESFSPDAAFYAGPLPTNLMKFIKGAPTFAAEVRSEGDYAGPAADRAMAEKRADYFEAGTIVVWDVDPIEMTIACYRNDDPDHPLMFSRHQLADAEPAVPGWRLDTNWLFS